MACRLGSLLVCLTAAAVLCEGERTPNSRAAGVSGSESAASVAWGVVTQDGTAKSADSLAPAVRCAVLLGVLQDLNSFFEPILIRFVRLNWLFIQ